MVRGDDSLPSVDVLILCRPGMRPPEEVLQAIKSQEGVKTNVHVGIGAAHPADLNRWHTIARGRNELKQLASAPWVMFVDDDVVLERTCVRSLIDALSHSPTLGAIAADSAGDQLKSDWQGHIGMAACMFRRETLARLRFRATESRCECWCCCNDLRQSGVGITYCNYARAIHLRGFPTTVACANAQTEQAVVLAAFDRRDIARFERQFVHSLRVWGNEERLITVAYGLYPSEIRRLGRLPNVDVIPRVANGQMAPVRRLYDFAEITSGLAPNIPVAYWDVADVVFQSSLKPLWNEVVRNESKVLAVIEPKSYPHNGIIPAWSLSIREPFHRNLAFDLLKRNGFLNSGFAAGTAVALHRYFDNAWQMREGPQLAGTTDWGDQMCLNVYCHSHPDRWKPIQEGWNFCVHDRTEGEVHVSSDGVVSSRRIGKIPVVHGNARSLRKFAILV